MKKISKKKSLIFIVVGILILLSIWFSYGIYWPSQPASETQVVVNIEKGQGLREIALNLRKEGIIKSENLFNFFALISGVQNNLQAGKYALSPSMNIAEIVKKLSEGETIKEKITIIEGWNLRDIGFYLENKGIAQAEELWEIAGFPAVDYSKTSDLPKPNDFSQEFEFLKAKPENVSLEGYLFPDTYEITPFFSVEEIIKKMLENFKEKINSQLKEEIKKQGKTLHQILTMASLLEDEMQNFEDRQIAAGILWKRLKSGWPLQVDATLTYITGKPSSELTKQDLQIDSSYNTYKYYGLPLGPICNPGLEAIKAAVYYKPTSYWFYLTTPEGETIFSETLEEHNMARAKYLK